MWSLYPCQKPYDDWGHFVLLGESLLAGSIPVLVWCLVFVQGCLILIPFWEEPDLERRFGEKYLAYKLQVPRWIPKLKSTTKVNQHG